MHEKSPDLLDHPLHQLVQRWRERVTDLSQAHHEIIRCADELAAALIAWRGKEAKDADEFLKLMQPYSVYQHSTGELLVYLERDIRAALIAWRRVPHPQKDQDVEARVAPLNAGADRQDLPRRSNEASPILMSNEIAILVFREDDGRYAAEYNRRNEAGMGEYSATPIGALANLCATLIKVDEDNAQQSQLIIDAGQRNSERALAVGAAPPAPQLEHRQILGYRAPITSAPYSLACIEKHHPWKAQARPPVYDTHETCIQCGKSLRAAAPAPQLDENMKLRSASESVGWMDSVGPLTVAPHFPGVACKNPDCTRCKHLRDAAAPAPQAQEGT